MTVLITKEGLARIHGILNQINADRKMGLHPQNRESGVQTSDVQRMTLSSAVRDHRIVGAPIPNGTVQIGCVVEVNVGKKRQTWTVGDYHSTDTQNGVLAYDAPLLLGMMGKKPFEFNELNRVTSLGEPIFLVLVSYPDQTEMAA